MPADRDKPTLAQLRKLAREALGEDAQVIEECTGGGMRWQMTAWTGEEARLISTSAGPQHEARRQLRDLLTLIVMGRAAAKSLADRMAEKERRGRGRKR